MSPLLSQLFPPSPLHSTPGPWEVADDIEAAKERSRKVKQIEGELEEVMKIVRG